LHESYQTSVAAGNGAAPGIVAGQMDEMDETGSDQPGTADASLDLDALPVGDRCRLFNFTGRDDHLAYL
jgi:hypothetical protein